MLFGTRYTFTGDRSEASAKALLEAFGEHGTPPGTIAHYVMADGRGGLVITEADSMADVYANLLHYTEWLEFESHPMLTVEETLPIAIAHYS